MNEIDILQNNLVHIRKVLKLSQKELGNLIGVTKMPISNYEKGRNKLTKRTYIAIKALVIHYKEIDESLAEEDYLMAQKLLKEKVVNFDYKKGLIFNE